MKKPNDPKVVNIADARARKKPKAPDTVAGPAISIPDITDVSVLFSIAFGLMAVSDPGLKQLRKDLHKDFGKKQVAVIHSVVEGFLRHLGPDDTARVLTKAGAALALSYDALLAWADAHPTEPRSPIRRVGIEILDPSALRKPARRVLARKAPQRETPNGPVLRKPARRVLARKAPSSDKP